MSGYEFIVAIHDNGTSFVVCEFASCTVISMHDNGSDRWSWCAPVVGASVSTWLDGQIRRRVGERHLITLERFVFACHYRRLDRRRDLN